MQTIFYKGPLKHMDWVMEEEVLDDPTEFFATQW